MKKILYRFLMFTASCAALTSGIFWLLSARAQVNAMNAPPNSRLETLQMFLKLSAEMNHIAAIAALCAGGALVTSALFED